jgi:predicted phosphate transport protein (TIGR00153 family)
LEEQTVRFNLTPKNEKFFEYFIEQAQLAGKAARVMVNLVEDFTNVKEKVKAISDLEHQGDRVVHDVAIHLAKTFVTPIDREDIHEICSYLDDILDLLQGAATRMELYKITQPTTKASELAQVIVLSTDVILEGVKVLSTFGSIAELKRQCKALEKRGDQINREAIAELFENGKPVIDVIKWKDLYQRLEDAINKCEDIFDILECVVLIHA